LTGHYQESRLLKLWPSGSYTMALWTAASVTIRNGDLSALDVFHRYLTAAAFSQFRITFSVGSAVLTAVPTRKRWPPAATL